VAIVERIARHSGFAARQRAMDLCLREIRDLRLAGRITAEQARVLGQTLRGSPGPAV
jgi:hypothetical protein